MRSSLLGVLAVLGIAGFAGHSLAADVVAPEVPALIKDAYLELYVAYTFLDGDFLAEFEEEDDDFFAGGGAAYWSVPLSDVVSLQLDGTAEITENEGEDDETNYEHSIGAAAHLSYRDPTSHLIGVFGGVSHAAVGHEGGENADTTGWFIGGEGQLYRDQNTFYVQAGFFDGGDSSDDSANILADTFFIRGQFRHYFSENFRAALDAAYAVGQVDEEDNTDLIDWGAELEYKPDELPVSLFVTYEGLDLDQNPAEDDTLTEHVFKVGLRWNFDGTPIFDRDRLGAGLDTPRFGRWQGEAGGPLE